MNASRIDGALREVASGPCGGGHRADGWIDAPSRPRVHASTRRRKRASGDGRYLVCSYVYKNVATIFWAIRQYNEPDLIRPIYSQHTSKVHTSRRREFGAVELGVEDEAGDFAGAVQARIDQETAVGPTQSPAK